MEAAYRQAAAAKRHIRPSARKNSEKRRLVQLAVSLSLFFVVFLGRGAFPELSDKLKVIISQDVSFREAFQTFGAETSEDKKLLTTLERLSLAVFGEPKSEATIEKTPNPDASIQKLIEITPLSHMQQHGLMYYRENGLRKYSEERSEASDPADLVSVPEVVTAVAQPYNERGEPLPRNVSYQHYELGLDQTVVPVSGEVTSGFDYRTSPISGQKEFHLALDIAAPKGTAIAAFADGVVRYIGENDDFGLYLMIDHDNGVATFYAHCSELLVHKGDKVSCGETVALVGNTGNATGYHLHFTIEKDNIRLNPAYYVDP